jgi:hypothetical protein
MEPRRESPQVSLWHPKRIVDVVDTLTGPSNARHGAPFILGIDGRSSSGKTSLATRFHKVIVPSSVVHADDIAWRHSRFGWGDLIVEGVLRPLREGRAVRYRPPAWEHHDRPGAIEVSAGQRLVVVEGVGVGRRELSQYLDALLWVESDPSEVERREARRVTVGELDKGAQEEWMREEVPFLAAQRPWERAALVVSGTPNAAHDTHTEIVVADRRA